jgi:serine/threonine-protein kinase
MDVKAYLAGFDNAEKIARGMAGDEKYHCFRGGEEFLLRIADGEDYEEKEREFEHLKMLSDAGLPVPKCIELDKSDDGSKVFTLLSWVKGEEAEKLIPNMSPKWQYELGKQAGDILRRIHDAAPVKNDSKNWYERYFEVITPRIDAYKNEGIPFEGSDKILGFIEENKHLMKSRPLCHHHGDYHTGNLIVNDGKLWVIDWHTMDFDSIGDPWYEFNRLDTKYPEFAKGQIDAYFDDDVPDEFWRLFALYISASAITSIVWAKYWAPDKLDDIMGLNRSVLNLFDNMANPIPKWYR